MYLVRTFANEQEARAYRAANCTGGLIFVPDDRAHETVLFPPHAGPVGAMQHALARDRAGRLVPDDTDPGSDAWYRIKARELFELDGLVEIPEYAAVERDEQEGTGAWVTARVWVPDQSD